MTVMGRPKRGLIDVLKSKAWIAESKRLANVESTYALNKLVHGKDGADLRYFERIQRGTNSPGAGLLRDVNNRIEGSRDVYLIGPIHEGKYVPLWKAIGGSIEEAWEVLEWFEPAYARSRLFGFTQNHRVEYLLSQMSTEERKIKLESGPVLSNLRDKGMGVLSLPSGGLTPEDTVLHETQVWIYRRPVDPKSDMIDMKLSHPVTEMEAKGSLVFDLRILAATVALWRLSHFTGELWREMDDLMRGLILSPGKKFLHDVDGNEIGSIPSQRELSAIGRVLQPYQIKEDFIKMVDEIWKSSAEKYAAVIHSLPRAT